MLRQKRIVLLLAGLVLLGIGVGAGGWWLQVAAQGAGDPFMGMSDPNAPYDQRFIDEMVMHHQGAIMSAQMMIADSDRPELRDLARRIAETQQREIEQMRAWRAAWFGSADVPVAGMDPMAGMMHDEGMMGGRDMGGMMGREGMMDPDRMFLRMMIPHHQLAIDMAEDALKNGQHEELQGLARETIAGQSAEITEMEGYLREWYGDPSTRDVADNMRGMMRQMMGH